MQTVSSAQQKHCVVHINEEKKQPVNLVWVLSKRELTCQHAKQMQIM